MFVVIKQRLLVGLPDEEKPRIIAEIFADTTDDIKNLTEVDGYIFSVGSLAYVVETGGIYAIKSDGIWHTTDGEAIS